MALSITESCVNCWACVQVCPNDAVVESRPHFQIKAQACTECVGEFAEPQCASICPIEEALVDDFGVALNPLGSLTGIPAILALELKQQSLALGKSL